MAPHVDYAVAPEWAFGLLESGKISADTARGIIIGTCRNVPLHLKNLDGLLEAKAAGRRDSEASEARGVLQQRLKPLRVVPAVVAWQRQFAEHAWRYKFLVLDGPSCTGKSIFARGQSPEGRSLLVDCSNASVPDMAAFNPAAHDVVVFDEATASLVLKHKKLFQAPPETVVLGSSATNCFVQRLMVYRKKLIVCSNHWSRELQKQDPEDRAWLEHNAVTVRVTEPLWLDASDAESPRSGCILPVSQ